MLVTCIRPDPNPNRNRSETEILDQIRSGHKQVMSTYLPRTEILDPKCLLLDAVSGSGPDPV